MFPLYLVTLLSPGSNVYVVNSENSMMSAFPVQPILKILSARKLNMFSLLNFPGFTMLELCGEINGWILCG